MARTELHARPRAHGRLFFLLLPIVFLGGCANLGYYVQAINGQMDIMHRERPVEQVLSDPRTPPELKHKLAAALAIREFASRELALPDNRSFHDYAELHRPFVAWNVFAAPEFSVKLHEWCFVFAGCVAYRGYFSEASARKFADGMKAQGYDVFVAGVPAYSTLGWFRDPLLSSFLRFDETEVARLLFHELAHQIVYVRDDTVFNESYAATVEEEGMRRWLNARADAQMRVRYETARERIHVFFALMQAYRARLATLYASDLSTEDKRAGKAQIIAELGREYARLKEFWGGGAGFDEWPGETSNNAQLGSVAAYTQLMPQFRVLLARCQGELPRFYAVVREIARLPKEERLARLYSGAQSCGS